MADYPTEMTPELERILGMPNFVCGPFARAFREGGADIPTKAEAEQAFVIHKLIGFYLEHGADYAEKFHDELAALEQKLKANAA